jgi:predicted MFS family arabinose efflux permease
VGHFPSSDVAFVLGLSERNLGLREPPPSRAYSVLCCLHATLGRQETGGLDPLQVTNCALSTLSEGPAVSLEVTKSGSFSRLVWSNLAAQAAEQIGLAAALLVAVLVFSAGPGAVGALQAAQTLPFLLVAIPIGVLADRVSRPRLMAAAETLRVVSFVLVLVLFETGSLTLPLLALLGFIGACGTVAYSVSAPALVPSVVSAAALPAANARIEVARTSALAAGPAVGGVLVEWFDCGWPIAAAAALSVTAAALLLGIKEPPRPTVTRRDVWRDMRDGAAFVAGHPLLRPIFATQFTFNVALFVIQAMYVPYAVDHLGLSPAGVGTTLAALGGGMVTGALVATRVLNLLRFGVVVAIGPVAGFAAALIMVSTIWVPSAALAGLSFFLLGAGPILWVVSTTTLRQTVTPEHLLGRVSAINSLAYGARPVGAAIGALVGASLGASACLGVAAALFMLQAGLILASPAVGLRRLPPHDHGKHHADSVGAPRLVMSIFGRSSGKVRPSTI